MDFSLTPELAAFASDVRALLRDVVDESVHDEVRRTGTANSDQMTRALAARGWLQECVPGGDSDPMKLYLLFSEMEKIGAPYEALAVNLLAAGVIAKVGTPSQTETIFEPLVNGEANICLGYSEPDAGSDLTAVSTRAVANGDTWTINGSKMWTTMAHESRWILMLTRTQQGAPRRGDTMFLVDMDTPGISVEPVQTMGGERVNAVFFTDVAVPDDRRLGEINGAWSVMTIALALERGVLGNSQHGVSLLGATTRWLQGSVSSDGQPLLADPSVREAVAQVAIDNQVGSLLGLRAAVRPNDYAAGIAGSMVKVFVAERYARNANVLAELCGPFSVLQRGVPGAAGAGAVDYHVRHSPIARTAGGTTEINRNNIAERHLGLPRAR